MIDVLADEWSDVVINMGVEVRVGVWVDIGALADTKVSVDIIVVTPVIIVLEFVMPVPYVVVHGLTTVVVEMWAGAIIGVVDVNINLLKVAVIIVFECVTTPSEETFTFWPNAILDRARASQAWMPSDHV